MAEQEGLDCEEQALQIAAKSAKGSVRTSLQNLQKAVNFVGSEKITADDMREALGAVDDRLYFDLVESAIEGNMLKAFETVNSLFVDGKEAGIVVNGVYEHLNNLLIARTCPNDLEKFGFTLAEQKRYSHQAGILPSGNVILKMMSYLGNVAFDVEYSLNPAQSFNKFAVESIQYTKNLKAAKARK